MREVRYCEVAHFHFISLAYKNRHNIKDKQGLFHYHTTSYKKGPTQKPGLFHKQREII